MSRKRLKSETQPGSAVAAGGRHSVCLNTDSGNGGASGDRLAEATKEDVIIVEAEHGAALQTLRLDSPAADGDFVCRDVA